MVGYLQEDTRALNSSQQERSAGSEVYAQVQQVLVQILQKSTLEGSAVLPLIPMLQIMYYHKCFDLI